MAKYIINSGGAIQQIRDEDWAAIQAYPTYYSGWNNEPPMREATPDEIATWWNAQGMVYDPATGAARPQAQA